MTEHGQHPSSADFRRQAHAAVDWIADYWDSLADRPVLAQVRPGSIGDQLPGEVGDEPEPFEAVLADLDRFVVDGLTHWQHPRYFAYFPANSSPAGVLGDLLSSGIGAQGMIWATSPAVTELEQAVLDQFARALGLPESFCHRPADGSPAVGGGVISDTASTATFTALLAALHRASGGTVRAQGIPTGRYAIYGSTQAHSSLQKAAMMCGLGEQAVRTIEVDPATQAMVIPALRAAVQADLTAGITPVLIQAAVGSTSTGAIDDVAELAVVAEECGAWLHVDAAWAGVAAVCPEFRWLVAGVDRADSFVTNPHKWLLTTFDCSTFWVRDRRALTGSLSILPEYLRNSASESGAVVDFRDWHPQLGRRFRSLKLWTVLRTYGVTGLQAHIRAGVRQARLFADLVLESEVWELVTPPVLGLVVFAAAPQAGGEEATRRALRSVNESGLAYLSHTVVDGRFAIRLATGSWRTTEDDIRATFAALVAAVSPG